jgi:hypothetical protein
MAARKKFNLMDLEQDLARILWLKRESEDFTLLSRVLRLLLGADPPDRL